MEEVERLLRTDAEKAAQRGAVLGEIVEDLSAAGPEALAKVAQIGAEVSEICRDSEGLTGRDEEPVRLACLFALLEDLGQGDAFAVAVVDEDAEDHRVGLGAGAEADRP